MCQSDISGFSVIPLSMELFYGLRNFTKVSVTKAAQLDPKRPTNIFKGDQHKKLDFPWLHSDSTENQKLGDKHNLLCWTLSSTLSLKDHPYPGDSQATIINIPGKKMKVLLLGSYCRNILCVARERKQCIRKFLQSVILQNTLWYCFSKHW